MSNQCISFGDTGFFARVVKEKCKKIAQNLNWKRKEILRKNVSGTIFIASFLRQTNKKDSLSPMSDYVTICRHTLSWRAIRIGIQVPRGQEGIAADQAEAPAAGPQVQATRGRRQTKAGRKRPRIDAGTEIQRISLRNLTHSFVRARAQKHSGSFRGWK